MGFVGYDRLTFFGALALPVEYAFALGRAMLYIRRTSVAFSVINEDNLGAFNGEAQFFNLGVSGFYELADPAAMAVSHFYLVILVLIALKQGFDGCMDLGA